MKPILKSEKILHQYFDGVADITKTVKDESLYTFKGKRSSRDNDDYDFYGTDTIEEAFDMADNGWKSGLKDVPDIFISHFSGIVKRQFRYSTHGLTIDVGRYLQGRPDVWLNEYDSNEESINGKVKRIAVGSSFDSEVSANQVKNRASALLAIIDILETIGYRVELDVISSSEGFKNGLTHSVVTRIKDAGQPLNRERVLFSMHPAFFRRFVFALREQFEQEYLDEFKVGSFYGKTIDLSKFIEKYPSYFKNTMEFDLVLGDQTNMGYYDTIESSVSRVKEYLKKLNIELSEEQ